MASLDPDVGFELLHQTHRSFIYADSTRNCVLQLEKWFGAIILDEMSHNVILIIISGNFLLGIAILSIGPYVLHVLIAQAYVDLHRGKFTLNQLCS